MRSERIPRIVTASPAGHTGRSQLRLASYDPISTQHLIGRVYNETAQMHQPKNFLINTLDLVKATNSEIIKIWGTDGSIESASQT